MNEFFTEDKIKKIIEDIEDEEDFVDDIIDEDRLKKLKSKSKDLRELGVLFFECYEIFANNLHLFKGDVEEKLVDMLKKFEGFDKLRESVNIYVSDDYGAYWEGERIKDYVVFNSKDIKNLIGLFFSVFIGD